MQLFDMFLFVYISLYFIQSKPVNRVRGQKLSDFVYISGGENKFDIENANKNINDVDDHDFKSGYTIFKDHLVTYFHHGNCTTAANMRGNDGGLDDNYSYDNYDAKNLIKFDKFIGDEINDNDNTHDDIIINHTDYKDDKQIQKKIMDYGNTNKKEENKAVIIGLKRPLLSKNRKP